MRIGAMNHPQRDVIEEIAWIAERKFDFIDLTLEPPAAATWKIDSSRVRAALETHGLDVVGHTAFYLSIGSPFESIRQAAVVELTEAIKVFAAIGARWMNVHPDAHTPFQPLEYPVQRNLQSLRQLAVVANDHGVGLMIENIPGRFNSAAQLAEILDALPDLGLHLDIGHCNLMVPENTTEEILDRFKGRLRHVHLHDNRGGSADLHWPLGAGTLDYAKHLRSLRATGYDGTITLEVFTGKADDLLASCRTLRKVWDEAEVTNCHR